MAPEVSLQITRACLVSVGFEGSREGKTIIWDEMRKWGRKVTPIYRFVHFIMWLAWSPCFWLPNSQHSAQRLRYVTVLPRQPGEPCSGDRCRYSSLVFPCSLGSECVCMCVRVCVCCKEIDSERDKKKETKWWTKREREREPLALGSYVPKDVLQLWCLREQTLFRRGRCEGSVIHNLNVLVWNI